MPTKEYYAQHKEKYREYSKQYREANKLLVRDYDKKYKESHKEKLKELGKSWYRSTKESYKEHRAEYRRNNREKRASYERNRRANKRKSLGTIHHDLWMKALEFYGNVCLCCGTTDNLTLDHVIPLKWGGKNVIENAQPLCLSCNSSKRDRHSTDYRNGRIFAE